MQIENLYHYQKFVASNWSNIYLKFFEGKRGQGPEFENDSLFFPLDAILHRVCIERIEIG